MGKYYNKGWTVPDTNIVATIVRRMDPDYPLDKEHFSNFAEWVQLNRTYRTVKIMSGYPYADKYINDIIELEKEHKDLRELNINELTDDEWDFICELPVEESQCVSH